MLLFAISEDAVVKIIELLTPVILAVIAYFAYRAERATRKVAKTLEETTTVVNDKLDDVAVNVEHGVKLNNSTLLASTKLVMEADERMANSSDATDEDRFRAEASKKHYLRMVEEQEKLGREMEKAAEKRAAAKLKAASGGGSEAELAELKEIKENTGVMADKMTTAMNESTEATSKMTDAVEGIKDAERDKER